MKRQLRLLFVCLANTCRSPMAECIMNRLVLKNQLNWMCDSAALRSWNVGIEPAARCQEILKQNGMKSKHLARLITPEDFQTFDYILCMDNSNLRELEQMAARFATNSQVKIRLLGSYLQEKEKAIIKDPYFSKGTHEFYITFSHIHASCEKFLHKHRYDKEEQGSYK